jgi:predicted secreted acid phosphatase
MIVALAAALALAAADEPRAPATADEIVAYRSSGEWRRDTGRAIDRARRALARALDERTRRRPAIVLDVDDTALSSYGCLKEVGFERARADCGTDTLPAIAQTRRLFRTARRHGVAVFFITGRPQSLRTGTAANLRAEGYRGYRRLIMRSRHELGMPAARYKARERRALARRGYRIVVNVGDQRSDLRGGWAVRPVKLPNPMYRIR